MKKKRFSKKIDQKVLVRLTSFFTVGLCVALVVGTVWFFVHTLNQLAAAQRGGKTNPPKLAAVDPKQLEKVLKGADERRADDKKLPDDFPNPYLMIPIPPAPVGGSDPTGAGTAGDPTNAGINSGSGTTSGGGSSTGTAPNGSTSSGASGASASPTPSQGTTVTTPTCTDDVWECAAWGPCGADGRQVRGCQLKTDCKSVVSPEPTTWQKCTPPTK